MVKIVGGVIVEDDPPSSQPNQQPSSNQRQPQYFTSSGASSAYLQEVPSNQEPTQQFGPPDFQASVTASLQRDVPLFGYPLKAYHILVAAVVASLLLGLKGLLLVGVIYFFGQRSSAAGAPSGAGAVTPAPTSSPSSQQSGVSSFFSNFFGPAPTEHGSGGTAANNAAPPRNNSRFRTLRDLQ